MKTSVQKAQQAYQRKRYRTTLRHYQMIPENERDESIMLNMAYCHKALRQYEAVEACCRNILEKNPDNAEAHVILLKTYLNRCLLDQAEIEIQALKSINSEEADIYNGMAFIKISHNELGSAMELLQKSLAIDPDNFNTHMQMGYVFRMKGEHKKALAEFRKALSINWRFEVFKYACAEFSNVNLRLIAILTTILAALMLVQGFHWLVYVVQILLLFYGLLALSFKKYLAAVWLFLIMFLGFFI
jgi:tetratricopeptide (TPR) repeat protein